MTPFKWKTNFNDVLTPFETLNAFFSKRCFQSREQNFSKNDSIGRSEILTQPFQIYSSEIDRRNKLSDNYF